MAQSDERTLIEQIKKNPHFFSILYDRHYSPIFSYVFRRLANYEPARDITAETFLKAYQNIGKYRWKNIPVSSWLYRIASNEVNAYFRKSKTRAFQSEDINLHFYLQHESGVETEKDALEKAFQENKEFATVQQELLKLEDKYQIVISLRFFEDKSIHEIVEITGRKESTVKSLLFRGLQKLRMEVEKKLNAL